MPSTPTGTTHASFRPKRAPTAALATRSPMSTNPPIAVRIPRVMARIFFTGAPSRVVLEERAQRRDVAVDRLGDLRELGEVAAASGDPHVGDVVLRGGEDVAEIAAHLIGAV